MANNSKGIVGYVGVIDGRPVFTRVSDEKGDFRAVDVYKTPGDALERWAYVRKVTITLGPEITQSKSRGRL